MNNIPRLKLREIVRQYGSSICDDPRRCEALLRDLCGEQHLEINILIGALKQRVAADLLGSAASIPRQLLFAQLAKRLHDNLGFTQDFALWGVESWAFALGIISTQELSTVSTGTPHITQNGPIVAEEAGQGHPSTARAASTANAGSPTSSTSSEEVLRQAAKMAAADGVIADAERAMLNDLAYRLGVPYNVSTQIFSEMDGQAVQGIATTAGKPDTPGTPGTSQPTTRSRGTAAPNAPNAFNVPNAPPVLTVAQDGSGDYTTIGAAISNAQPGTRILVQPGLYRESLVFDKALEIFGDGRLADIIIESLDITTRCITSSAIGAKVKGITLRGPILQNADTQDVHATLWIKAGHLAIEGCVIQNSAYGLWVNGSAQFNMINCSIRDCTGSGIYAFWEAQGIIEDCEIYNAVDGVSLGDTSKLTLRRCKIHDVRENGIFAFGEAQGIIEDCEIYNTLDGVTIGDTSTLTLHRCKIHNANDKGIHAHRGAQGIIEDCEIYNNPDEVAIAGTSTLTLRRCKIQDFINDGSYAIGEAHVIFQDCKRY